MYTIQHEITDTLTAAAPYAKQLIEELFGNTSAPKIMMGVKCWWPLAGTRISAEHAGLKGHAVAGVRFHYSSRLVSNKSNNCELWLMADGSRLLRWGKWDMRRETPFKEVERARCLVSDMERVWWEHTACAVRMPRFLPATRKFKLGTLVETEAIQSSLSQSVRDSILARHASGDWGELSEDDKAANNEALQLGNDRIFSAYNTSEGRVYIITEWDMSATTIMFSCEY